MAVTVNLGRVQPIYRGPYSPSFPYRPLDFVTFDGVTYYCIKPVTGTAPPDTEFWVSILQLPLGIAAGGTGAITAEGARTALGASAVGDAVFTAADAAAARGAMGASAVGGGVFVAEDQAAARAALGGTNLGSALFTAADPAAGRAALEILQAIAANPFLAMPIGHVFTIDMSDPGVVAPDNSGAAKFVELTAGLTGLGQFNEGLLINESVSGEGPLIVATAEIAVGPSAGHVIHLHNTEGSGIRPGLDDGTLEFDQMQRIIGNVGYFWFRGSLSEGGAFSIGGNRGNNRSSDGSSSSERGVSFNSANSPNARVSDTTEGETRIKAVKYRAFRRIV